ncbi:MAG: UvrD-helicase domain-containing protein, partial [Bacteroidota bacterium]
MITIYKSSAGSGKTFTLVLEYLKIVLANPSLYRNVLAVTFTNKATEEMKNRIIQVLSTLAHASAVELSANSYYQKLEEHFEGMEDLPMPHLSLQDRALLVLQKILNDYSNFSVSTIESFFQRIVRAFARELQIPLGYEVEMKQDVVLREIVNRTFMEIRGDGSELEKLFTRFAESNIEEEKSWNIDREVLDLGEQVFKEKYQQLVNDYEGTTISPKEVSELAKELQKIKYEFEGQMARFGERAEKIMHTYGLEVDDFLQKKRGPMAFLLRLKQQPPLKFDHVNPQSSSYLRKLLNGEGAWASKTAPRADQVEAAAETGLNPLLDEINGYTYKNLPAYAAALQALSKVYAFGVLSELQSKLQEYRREHGQLIISDTSFLLNKVVAEQEDSPFIYEKVGNRYDHYLLDEFQDTSDMQWRNLFPLILESVANGKKGLIVGDVKQSIYRWRNGNMRLLMRAVEDKMAAFGRPT